MRRRRPEVLGRHGRAELLPERRHLLLTTSLLAALCFSLTCALLLKLLGLLQLQLELPLTLHLAVRLCPPALFLPPLRLVYLGLQCVHLRLVRRRRPEVLGRDGRAELLPERRQPGL